MRTEFVRFNGTVQRDPPLTEAAHPLVFHDWDQPGEAAPTFCGFQNVGITAVENSCQALSRA
jgi:hypothetical protein